MKILTHFLGAAVAVLAIFAFATEARAQFPMCNGNQITVTNFSNHDVEVCIKFLPCFTVPAGQTVNVPVLPGTPVPGVAGVANTTYQWQPGPFPRPTVWVPSLAMNPTGFCFNVIYDGNCGIRIIQTSGPPCINP